MDFGKITVESGTWCGEEVFLTGKRLRFVSFSRVVHDSCPVLEKVDGWVWKANKFQEFSVNSAYGLLRGVREGDGSRMFNSFWRIKALLSA